MPGEHNAINSSIACVLAIISAPTRPGSPRGSRFRGVDRRLQYLGDRCGVRVYDDYGTTRPRSRPRARSATSSAEDRDGPSSASSSPTSTCRTRFLLERVRAGVQPADVVIVRTSTSCDSEIREDSSAPLTSSTASGNGRSRRCLYPSRRSSNNLEVLCRPGDLLVVMGAGPVWQIAHGYLKIVPAQGVSSECPHGFRHEQPTRNRPA